MKKLTIKYKKYLLKKSLAVIKYRTNNNKVYNLSKADKKGYEILPAPNQFCLVSNDCRERLISFVNSIHRLVNKGKRKIWLDFTFTNRLVASGMIYLYAEVSRMKVLVPDLDIRSTAPIDKIVGQAFNRIGFSKLVKCNIKRNSASQSKNVITWMTAEGEGVFAEKFEKIITEYRGRIAPPLSRELFKGITEAMTNAHHHAYIQDRGDLYQYDDTYRPWWLFTREVDDKLSVIFCDLGVGIPRTLPITKPDLVEYLRGLLGDKLTESRTIEEAVKDSVTRTKKTYRGKGLRQVVETVNNCSEGEVYILSNSGCYYYKTDEEPVLRDYSSSIRGTVVAWRLSLPKKEISKDMSPEEMATQSVA